MLRIRITSQLSGALNRRLLSTIPDSVLGSVDAWIASPKEMRIEDALHAERVADLYITLPTRDGVRRPYAAPKMSEPLGYGHHLAFFYHRTPESLLRPDGTDGEFCPPEPFTRRMWAGGRMLWNNQNPMLIGGRALSTLTVASVQKKGFERGKPKLFVDKHIEYVMEGKKEVSMTEERVHVYLPHVASERAKTRGPLYNTASFGDYDFCFAYKPSLTTLFRFSSMLFNAHHIHLDKDYAVQKEGYEERLVHGPLTALMLLEAVVFHRPESQLKEFKYMATNPLVVGREHLIYGKYVTEKSIKMSCISEDGVEGMVGSVELE